MEQLPFSLVTTCRNEMRSLPRWKQNIHDQTRPPTEIIVVDAFSDDGTYEFLTEWAENDNRLKIIQEKGAAAHGRNVAIDHASFEHILSTDMGVRLVHIWCEELVKPFEANPSIEVVAGNTCIDTETVTSLAGRCEYILEKGGFPRLEEGYVPGNRSIAYKKRIWDSIGKLPEDLTFYADDSVFGRQLVQGKYKFAYAPGAQTFWGRPTTFNAFFKEQYVYGKGDGEAFIKTPRAFKWHLSGQLPKGFIAPLQALINLIKTNTWTAVIRAVSRGRLKEAVLIPYFNASRSYNHARGYIEGYEAGLDKCSDCRNRLQRNKEGYSLI